MTACRSITHVVNLGSHPATLWRRLSLAAYLVHVYLYLPIMTAYDHVLHVKSDEKKWHRNPSRHRFAKIDQPNYRSASMFLLEYWCRLGPKMQTLNTVGSILKKCEKTLSQLHIVYFSLESKCKYMEESKFVCDSPYVHNEVDNVWWRTQLPVVRDVWWRTQLPGVTRNWCNAETL